jgi:rhodanese-related sulfurtransferase
MFNLFKKKEMNYKNINSEEFKKIQEENPDAVVLDVRTAGEVRGGKIPGATNIDIMDQQFAEKVEKLDKDKTYLVYCRSGNRSGQACGIMAGKGFDKLYNLNGGVGGWPYETK